VSTHESAIHTLNLLGGTLCLDFVNTVDWRARSQQIEYLHQYSDLLVWGQYVGVLDDSQAQALVRGARSDPREAVRAFHRAIELREALYRIFSAAARDTPASAADLTLISEELSHAMAQSALMPGGEAYLWDWPGDRLALDRVLWPVVRSAAALLTSDHLQHVHLCEGEGCGWLFLDTTKNHSRRWCRMGGCGNRAKARRHYHRTRG